MLDSLHGDRGRLCKLLAAWRRVVAADWPWRRRRRRVVRAPAVVFGPAGFTYRLVLGIILFAAMCAAFLFASGWGSRPRDEELTPIEDDDTPFEEEGDRSSVSLDGCITR